MISGVARVLRALVQRYVMGPYSLVTKQLSLVTKPNNAIAKWVYTNSHYSYFLFKLNLL